MKIKTPNKNKRSWKINTSTMTTNLKQGSKLNLKQGNKMNMPKFGQRNENKEVGKLNMPNRRLSMPRFGQQQDKNVPKFGQRNESTQSVNDTLIEEIRKLDIRVTELENQKPTAC